MTAKKLATAAKFNSTCYINALAATAIFARVALVRNRRHDSAYNESQPCGSFIKLTEEQK